MLLDDAARPGLYDHWAYQQWQGRQARARPEVMDAIKNAKAGGKHTEIEGGGNTADGASRDIVGRDNRVQVANATTYPFSTVGYLQMETPKGEVWSCTAAMIGPNGAHRGELPLRPCPGGRLVRQGDVLAGHQRREQRALWRLRRRHGLRLPGLHHRL